MPMHGPARRDLAGGAGGCVKKFCNRISTPLGGGLPPVLMFNAVPNLCRKGYDL